MYVFPIGSAVITNNLIAEKNTCLSTSDELVALIAPRPIYIASAEEDNWSDQKGEFLGGKGAEPVYALYGLGGIGCEEMPPVDTPYMNGPIAYHKSQRTSRCSSIRLGTIPSLC